MERLLNVVLRLAVILFAFGGYSFQSSSLLLISFAQKLSEFVNVHALEVE